MALHISNYIARPDAGGKFVVLRSLTDPDGGILVVSDFTRHFQHRDIVGRWERDRGAGVAAAGFRVAGGGWWRYENPGFLTLYGQSAAYGRFDPVWLRDRLEPGMIGGEVRLDVR